ncbi:annexin-B12-like [Tubulanus polymorphus]|uniref:annexin-B12-like n=1 Tax=Tubulanus polymorphus TaxID=672921 RepID=UPI003DA4CD94
MVYGYGTGFASNYPTNSGPPMPMPNYNMGGPFGNDAMGAYSMQQHPYYYQQGYQGSAYTTVYSLPAAAPQLSYQDTAQPPPPPLQIPESRRIQQNALSTSFMGQQSYQLNCYKKLGVYSDDSDGEGLSKKQKKKEEKKQRKMEKKRGKKHKNRSDDERSGSEDEDDDEDDDDVSQYQEDPEEIKQKVNKLIVTLESKPDLREEIRNNFIDEMMRRQDISGTFEITQGTVRAFVNYGVNDPVNLWSQKELKVDITDKPWDAETDCEYLRAAMKGAGTDEAAIIHVVATRCNSQRQKLKAMFKTMYGKDLIVELRSELSGDFREAIMACFVKPAVYDAWCVKDAIYGLGTDEDALIEVLMTRTNQQIHDMGVEYPDVASPNKKALKGALLEKDIREDTSGDFKHLLISAVQGNRYDITREKLEQAVEELHTDDGKPTGIFQVNYYKLVDVDKAKRDAERLYKAGEKKWGTDEETFNLIFSTRDYYTLRVIWDEYVKISQRDILNSIDRETSGDFRSGLRAIAMNIKNRPMYFAERLVKAMKGLGTDDKTLIRIIISRSEIDMVQIKQCFLEITKQTLWRWLKDDTSGDYKRLLHAIVGRD